MRNIIMSLCASLFCVASATAQTPAPAAAAYTPNLAGYTRIHVTLSTGSQGRALDLDQCPRGSLFGSGASFQEFFNSDQTLNIGFNVTTPSNRTIQLAPVEVRIDRRWLQDPKCNIRIEEVHYVSPLYSTFAHQGGGFSVAPTLYRRARPSQDFVLASKAIAQEAAVLVGAPAPVAEQLGAAVFRSLDGAGANVTSQVGVQLRVVPRPGQNDRTSMTWTAQTGLTGAQTITIRAELESVASVMDTTRATLPADFNPAANRVLEAPVLGDFANGQARDLQALVLMVAPHDYPQFITKTVAAQANDSCTNIYRRLDTAGLSTIDRSLTIWSLARTHPLLGAGVRPEVNLESISCLTNLETTLNSVGVRFRTPPAPEPATTVVAASQPTAPPIRVEPAGAAEPAPVP